MDANSIRLHKYKVTDRYVLEMWIIHTACNAEWYIYLIDANIRLGKDDDEGDNAAVIIYETCEYNVCIDLWGTLIHAFNLIRSDIKETA